MKIRFFIDQSFLKQRNLTLATLPQTMLEFETWLPQHATRVIARETWTLQTYLRLKEAGADVELVSEPPVDGIVIAHADSFGELVAGPYRICICGDRMYSVEAELYVVQNQNDPRKPAYFMPFWPQFGLIPRKADREPKNVMYYGWEGQLAPELRTKKFMDAVTAAGFTTHYIYDFRQWTDYSQTDIVLAVRSFDKNVHNSKPAVKLYNAWLAGVPAIIGHESACLALRETPLDYLEARSPEEVISHINSLKNPRLYSQMVVNGHQRATRFTPKAITKRWLDFFVWLETRPR